jgi:hypothetical protein
MRKIGIFFSPRFLGFVFASLLISVLDKLASRRLRIIELSK